MLESLIPLCVRVCLIENAHQSVAKKNNKKSLTFKKNPVLSLLLHFRRACSYYFKKYNILCYEICYTVLGFFTLSKKLTIQLPCQGTISLWYHKEPKKFRSFLQLKHVKYLLNSISNTSEPKLHNFIYVIIFLHK